MTTYMTNADKDVCDCVISEIKEIYSDSTVVLEPIIERRPLFKGSIQDVITSNGYDIHITSPNKQITYDAEKIAQICDKYNVSVSNATTE
jgi:hypothetical protein